MKKFIPAQFILLVVLIYVSSCTKSVSDLTSGGSNGGSGSGGGNGSNAPTVTTPSTLFISDVDRVANSLGSYFLQQFTVNQTTAFVFRFAILYSAQAAIITESEVNAFKNLQSFSGYGLFDNVFGTKLVTLTPGTYYVAVRNTSNGQNKWSVELDLDITLPASDRATRYDYYLNDTKNFANGGKTWQAFTVQTGYRYFLDGCNVNTDFFVIPESELNNFQNNQTFNSYASYNGYGGEAPGFYEIKLNPGNYYLVSRSNQASSYTYLMERWKVN